MQQSENMPVERKAKNGRLLTPSGRFLKSKEAAVLREKMGPQRLDINKITAYAAVGCTLEEIAILLGVSPVWLDKQKLKDIQIEEALLSGQANLKQSLRSAQVKLALTGHPGMLIWLGKQFLGQSDKVESRTETQVNVTLQNAMKELRDLDKGDVLRIKSIIEGECEDVTEKGPPE